MNRPPPNNQRFGGPPPPNFHRPPYPGRMGERNHRGGAPFRGDMRGGPMMGGPPPQRMPPNGFRGGGPPGRGLPPHGRMPPMHMQNDGPLSSMNGNGRGFPRGGQFPPGRGGNNVPMRAPPLGPGDPGNFHGRQQPPPLRGSFNFHQARPPFGPGREGERNLRGLPGRGFQGRPLHMHQQQQQQQQALPPGFRGGGPPDLSGRGGRLGPRIQNHAVAAAGPFGLSPHNNLPFNPQQPPPHQQQQHQQPPAINNVQNNHHPTAPYISMASPNRGPTQHSALPHVPAVVNPAIPALETMATATNTVATSHHLPPGSPQATQVAATPRDWEEYTDAASGNTYYSNGVTSSWTKPAEMIEAERLRQSTHSSENGQQQQQTAGDTPDDPRGRKRKAYDDVAITYATKEEALNAFKSLLSERDVTPAHKWMEVAKLFSVKEAATSNSSSKDVKGRAVWKACENALTTGERKQALAEYQTKLAKDLRTKERQGRQRTKEAFLKLLSDVVSAEMVSRGEDSSQQVLRYQDVEGVLQRDDRYHAVESDEMREILFAEFWEEYRKREERRKQNDFRDAQNRFVAFLEELAEGKILTCSAPDSWNVFVASLRSSSGDGDNESLVSKDSRFTTLSSSMLNAEDKDYLFKNFLDGLIRSEEEAHRRSQEERREAAMAQHDFFRETLVQAALDGKIVPSTSYSSVVDSVLSQDASFIKLQQHNRDRPKLLFEEFVNSWNELYRRDRLFLSDIVRRRVEKSNAQSFKDETATFEDFCKILHAEAADDKASERVQHIIEDESNPVSSAQLYFNELKSSSSARRRTSQLTQSHRQGDSSSEDEGEIAEDD